MTELADHPFCRFAIALYGKEGVAAACLDLQDRHGIDVNVLLFSFWWAVERRAAMSRAGFESILEDAAEWNRTVVLPMRAARWRLKRGSHRLSAERTEALRQQVLAAEIGCELAEQHIIAQVADQVAGEAGSPVATGTDTDTAPSLAAASVGAYLAAIGVAAGPSDAPSLRQLFAACFPGDTAADASAGTVAPAASTPPTPER